jgi:hypothetical protein
MKQQMKAMEIILRVNVPLSKAYEYSIDVCGIMVKIATVLILPRSDGAVDLWTYIYN